MDLYYVYNYFKLKKKMRTLKFLSFLILGIIVVFGCNNDKKTTDIDNPETPKEDNILVYPMPTPFEVTNLIQSAGIPYNVSLTNSTENAAKYTSSISLALNLGIYGADLAYATTYNQAQNTRDFISISKKLADDLNLSDAIDQNFVNRIEKNIDNSDSIYKIVSSSFGKIYNSLNQQGKGNSALIVITGAWIESLYLATQLTMTANNQNAIMNKIGEQKYNYDNLIELLNKNSKDQNISELLKDLQAFKPIFDKVKTDEDGNTTFVVDDFDNFTKQIAKLRTKYVEMQ